MNGMSCYTVLQISLVTLMLVYSGAEVEGKRGCRSFGHSCYGGIGKRNREIRYAYDVLEKPVIPLPYGWNSYRNDQMQMRDLQKFQQLSDVIAQWMNNFKGSNGLSRKPLA